MFRGNSEINFSIPNSFEGHAMNEIGQSNRSHHLQQEELSKSRCENNAKNQTDIQETMIFQFEELITQDSLVNSKNNDTYKIHEELLFSFGGQKPSETIIFESNSKIDQKQKKESFDWIVDEDDIVQTDVYDYANSNKKEKPVELLYTPPKEFQYNQTENPNDSNIYQIHNPLINPVISMSNRTVFVSESETINEGILITYKLYRIISKEKGFGISEIEVFRRFSDFEWLHNELTSKFGGYLIPVLPEKNILTKFNIEPSSFSKQRQRNLEFYLQSLLDHPELHKTPQLKIFLTSQNEIFSVFKGEAESQKSIEKKCSNVIGSVRSYFNQQIIPLFWNQKQTSDFSEVNTDNNDFYELDKQLKKEEILVQNLIKKELLRNTQAAEEAFMRRNQINNNLQKDSQRISELNLANRNSTNTRDTELDVLLNSTQKNSQKLEQMTRIMASEMKDFYENQFPYFQSLINQLKQIQMESTQKAHSISQGITPDLI